MAAADAAPSQGGRRPRGVEKIRLSSRRLVAVEAVVLHTVYSVPEKPGRCYTWQRTRRTSAQVHLIRDGTPPPTPNPPCNYNRGAARRLVCNDRGRTVKIGTGSTTAGPVAREVGVGGHLSSRRRSVKFNMALTVSAHKAAGRGRGRVRHEGERAWSGLGSNSVSPAGAAV
jgi:hypothetical protein